MTLNWIKQSQEMEGWMTEYELTKYGGVSKSGLSVLEVLREEVFSNETRLEL